MWKKNIYKRFNKVTIKKKNVVGLADIATSIGEKLAEMKFTYPVDLVFQSMKTIPDSLTKWPTRVQKLSCGQLKLMIKCIKLFSNRVRPKKTNAVRSITLLNQTAARSAAGVILGK